MKANKKTLMAVKRFLNEEEGWDLEQIEDEIAGKIIPRYTDECSIVWDGEDLCNLQDFVDNYTHALLRKVCNVLDSFVGDDISCYFEDED